MASSETELPSHASDLNSRYTFLVKVSAQAQSACSVDPTSIESRASFDVGAGLIVRRRPPGGVDLAYGQKEHMLMCSVGKPVDNNTVRSVLRTANGRREWRSCPQGHITFVPAGFPIEWDWTYKSDSIHVTMLPSFLASVGEEFEKRRGTEACSIAGLKRGAGSLQSIGRGDVEGRFTAEATVIVQAQTAHHNQGFLQLRPDFDPGYLLEEDELGQMATDAGLEILYHVANAPDQAHNSQLIARRP